MAQALFPNQDRASQSAAASISPSLKACEPAQAARAGKEPDQRAAKGVGRSPDPSAAGKEHIVGRAEA